MENSNTKIERTLLRILNDRKLIIRLIFLVLSIIIILASTFCFVLYFIESRTDEIRVTETGAIIINVKKNEETASFLLSSNGGGSCTPWINTGIHLDKGDKIKFKYSGKINIGMHKMMQAASLDTILPPLPWSSAEGIDADICEPKRNVRTLEGKRRTCLIDTTLPQGRLIGTISSTSRPEHRPIQIIDVPKHTEEAYVVNEPGQLWLTVNESWLDLQTLLRFNETSLEMKPGEYNFIKNNNYCNVWYDDNSGFFNVTIEISK